MYVEPARPHEPAVTAAAVHGKDRMRHTVPAAAGADAGAWTVGAVEPVGTLVMTVPEMQVPAEVRPVLGQVNAVADPTRSIMNIMLTKREVICVVVQSWFTASPWRQLIEELCHARSTRARVPAGVCTTAVLGSAQNTA